MKMDKTELEALILAQNIKKQELSNANRIAANNMLTRMLATYSNLDPEVENISTGVDNYE